jgi:23S rRNA (uracil1939-C5)-methyltransferase
MKNKIYSNITIESMAAEGKCVARINGQAVFVEGVAPGDLVDLFITKRKRNFLEGRVIKLLKLSEHHRDPFCKHFERCGGCKWQQVAYEMQLKSKRQQVIDNFERIGKFPFPKVNEIIAADETTHYRNKLEYTFSNKRWLEKEEMDASPSVESRGVGFHLPNLFDKILDIDECWLQKNPSNAIRNALRTFALRQGLSFYDIRENRGLLRNLVIRTTSSDQFMVIVQFGEQDTDGIQAVMAFLANTFPEITSLQYVVNLKKNETFNDQELILYRGKPYIEENIVALRFRIGPKSFFQTNTSQTVKLYRKALDMAELTGKETVYDLYCGTGTIANFVARKTEKVIGIEVIAEAVADAHENALLNGIQNTTFITGDIKDMLSNSFKSTHGHPDVIITDPPRAGMHEDAVDGIIALNPKRIIYISCNPATQARDLIKLVENYIIQEVQPFDMFPHTHHLENIVSLKRKD